MNKRIYSICILALIACLLCTSIVFADSVSDGAGNVVIGDETPTATEFDRDLFWTGENFTLTDASVSKDLFALGYGLQLTNTTIGNSLRTGSYDLTLQNVTVDNNITSGAYSVTVDQDSKIDGAAYFAAYSVAFDGEAKALYVAANEITFNGKVDGNVYLAANNVTIGKDAEITGKLTVKTSKEPTIPETASIGTYNFEVSEETETDTETVVEEAKGETFGSVVLNILYWLAATIVIALFFCLFSNRELNRAARMVVKHPVAMGLSGLITLLVIPMLALLLCITSVGAPAAGLIALLTLVAVLFAVPYTGASAARAVLPRLNKVLASIIGAAVLSLVTAIPYFGTFVRFLCVIYVIGYYVQRTYLGLKKGQQHPELDEPAAADESAKASDDILTPTK